MQDFLKIKYRNSCDIAGSVFTVSENAFYYVIYLPIDIGNNSYEIIDEGREDGEKNFVSDFKKLQKKYTFTNVYPEYIYDALCHIQLHDIIYITSKYEEESRVFNFSVKLDEWTTSNVAKVTVDFTVDYTAKYGCCTDSVVLNYRGCRECNADVNILDIITSNSQDFNEPITINLPEGYYIVDFVHYFDIYSLSYVPTPNWGIMAVWSLYVTKNFNEVICFTHGSINYKFFKDGQHWQKYLILKPLTDTGTQINIKGFTLPNTWVQLQMSVNGGAYANYSTPIESAKFQIYGINVLALTTGNTYSFKFNLYDNNCNYGFSNILSHVKL